ncbi:hypothetical protein SAMN05421833_11438 [Microbispora rosea]|uniref:Uncharacterized protein n=1 Tax=Microbispora rosea TaxID=58117 RepID=A0A1N7DBJ7_9ACTN|nr:hypothetical protein Mro03_45830 [Microbispora rosea subsp. rosea]SIR73216.1 hypothetical protein SAMN05421833_11438 [Microbispora rosea]
MDRLCGFWFHDRVTSPPEIPARRDTASPPIPSLRAAWGPLALSYATAQLVEVFLHEGAHALAARAVGFHPAIGQFVELHVPSPERAQEALVAAGGPIGSLVTGLVCWALYRRRGPSYPRLLLMWLAMTGITAFLGYLVVMPLLTVGDTGVLARLYHVPVAVQFLVTAAGMALLYLVTRPLSRMYLDSLPASVPLDTPRDRKASVTRLWIPYLIGLALLVPAGLGGDPEVVFYGILGCWGPGMALVGFMTLNAGRPYERKEKTDAGWRLPVWAFLGYAAVVAFYLLVLRPGLNI